MGDVDIDCEAEHVRTLLTDILSSDDALSCDSILLSGGLDTSLAAEVLLTKTPRKEESKLRTCITVTVDPDTNPLAKTNGLFKEQPKDVIYARKIASKLDLTDSHHVITLSLDEVLGEQNNEMLELCVKTLKTFDGMDLRNAIAIAYGLKKAKDLGCKRVCTGDGADELFAGYSFMHSMDDGKLREYTKRMVKSMRFCAFPLAKALGIEVWSPYLDPRLIEYAISDHGGARSLKIGEFEGQVHGKLILRKAFPDLVSASRKKEAIEIGSGTTVLPKLADLMISDECFERERAEALKKYSIVVRSKELLIFFRVFKAHILDNEDALSEMPPRFDPRISCPECHFALRNVDSRFCYICGLYPAIPENKDLPHNTL